MPSSLLAVDTAFPQLTEEQSTEEKFGVVTNYLYMLMEQLRYSMANLGAGNFNDAELDAIGKSITAPIYIDLENAAGAIHELRITADQLTSRMEDAEGNISSIDQYARSITMQVSNGETSSSIKLLANGAVISSQVIVMDGLVTFKGLEDGTTVINGGCVQTGTIDAEYLNLTGAITFPDLSGDVQGDINDALDTANDAYDLAHANQLPGYIKSTYIDAVTVRSPTIEGGEIKGGRYYNNTGSAYLEVGGSAQGDLSMWGSGSNRVFQVYDEIGSMVISGYGVDILRASGADGKTYARGSWDFSGADVTGLTAVFA